MKQIENENKLVRKLFNINEIIDFQSKHEVQVIIESDWLYHCFIDNESYYAGLTPLGTLCLGINKYKSEKND